MVSALSNESHCCCKPGPMLPRKFSSSCVTQSEIELQGCRCSLELLYDKLEATCFCCTPPLDCGIWCAVDIRPARRKYLDVAHGEAALFVAHEIAQSGFHFFRAGSKLTSSPLSPTTSTCNFKTNKVYLLIRSKRQTASLPKALTCKTRRVGKVHLPLDRALAQYSGCKLFHGVYISTSQQY